MRSFRPRCRRLVILGSLTRFTLLLVALGSWATGAAAVPIAGLFATGVLDDGSVAASGSVDLHYTLIASPDPNFPGPNAIVADPIAAGYWLPNGSTSRWIAPAQNQGYPSGAANHASGTYTYRLTFDLTGLDPTTAEITGAWAADNGGVSIRLNGVDTGNVTPGYSALTAFTLSGGFVSGVNTLDFVVDEFAAGGANPTGLRVDGLAGTATPIPEPAVLALLGAGLAGFVPIGRRRREQS